MGAKQRLLERERQLPLPPLETTELRIARLADADFLGSPEHQELLWSHKPKEELWFLFLAAFVREAARRHIPIHCTDSWPDGLRIVHSQFGMRLQSDDWAIIGRIGSLAVRSVCPGRIVWGGDSISGLSSDPPEPDVWTWKSGR